MIRLLVVLACVCLPFIGFAQLDWTEQLLVEDLSGTRNAKVADLDSDGDMDVVACGTYESSLFWWENVNGDASLWNEHVVAPLTRCSDLYLEDINGDGHIDILARSGFEGLSWFENLNGDGLTWTQHIMQAGTDLNNNVSVRDMDTDGDMDVICSKSAGGSIITVFWWENLNGAGTSWDDHQVTIGPNNGGFHIVADMDGDTDLDIAISSSVSNYYGWWENVDGDGLTWSSHLVANYYPVGDLAVEDFDSDGDLDMAGVAFWDTNVFWWENLDGIGTSWTEHLVVTGFPDPDRVRASDIDQDGDIDLLLNSVWDGNVFLFENADGIGGEWVPRFVHGGFSNMSDACVADLDGNGTLEILSASRVSDEVIWWTQTEASPVDIDLVPWSSTYFSSAGGTLEFDIYVESSLPSTIPDVMVWTKAKLPDGSFYPNLLFSTSFTLLPFMNASGSLTVDVPAMAPAGDYELWGWIGYDPAGGPNVGDYFSFTKSDEALAADAIGQWGGFGSFETDKHISSTITDESVQPSAHSLVSVYPNPFNAKTSINIQLGETSDLTVAVYNISGQLVAELGDGHFSTGSHSLTLDASGMASGLYFVRATVPGQMDEIQKVMLVR
jgi:Secretion system C-terminal sorting domain/FG-GAP-like repeat